MRQKISGGAPNEPVIGFSRALCAGNHLYVSGTGPVRAAGAGAQTERIFEITSSAHTAAGTGLEHGARTRICLTWAEDWEKVARAHGRLFGKIGPATTMVVLAKPLNPGWPVGIEAEAMPPEESSSRPEDNLKQ